MQSGYACDKGSHTTSYEHINNQIESLTSTFRLQCILNVAEEVAESFQFNETEAQNFTYYSSKYSTANNVSIESRMGSSLPEIVDQNKDMYKPMQLDQDTHFYNISVNTTHSSVHVPINVYDKSKSTNLLNKKYVNE